MPFRFLSSLITALFCLCLPSCGQQGSHAHPPLLLAVSANFLATAEKLGAAFSEETKIPVQISSASSAKLATQIAHGAQFHVFLSADTLFPSKLHREGTLAAAPLTYCRGQLVLAQNAQSKVHMLSEIALPIVQKVAIPNPETAPYGQAAMQALERAGILEQVRPKLVIAESVAQTNLYLENGNVQVALTARSASFSPDKFTLTDIPDSLYSPILQGMAPTRFGMETAAEDVDRFMKFMFSEKARNIMVAGGYRMDF